MTMEREFDWDLDLVNQRCYLRFNDLFISDVKLAFNLNIMCSCVIANQIICSSFVLLVFDVINVLHEEKLDYCRVYWDIYGDISFI